ncbi:winged helix-turn-helix domain-containing protein [Streptococcus pneumoniae]|uniref:winged helix-turn-helix domain-containing protein n=1 Tax=Streptococcus pneumoniae TaxID=1313 RepID=UPI0034DACA79
MALGEAGPPRGPKAAWSWMKRLGFAPLRPRPRHRERDLAEGEAFKKTSSSRSFS